MPKTMPVRSTEVFMTDTFEEAYKAILTERLGRLY